MKDFKDLRVWTRAHELTLDIYKITRGFPREEQYGLTSQLRRATASIGANIAEGAGRRSDAELTRFLQIARGSASELEYHLLLARSGAVEDYQRLQLKLAQVQRMLTCLVQSVRPRSGTREVTSRNFEKRLLQEACQKPVARG